MKKIITLLTLIFSLLSYSQECGGGIYNIKLFQHNNDKIHYEIYEFEDVKNTIFPSDELIYMFEGKIISSKKVKEFKLKKVNKKYISRHGYLTHVPSIKLKNNQLSFEATEENLLPLLLRIWKKDTEVFILGYLFGGCDREVMLELTGTPKIYDTH